MNDNYYSMAFKNSSNLKSGMVYEYVEKDFKKVVDTLFLIIDLANERPIFRKPMHFIIAETANEIIIGINFDKAVYTNTTLVTMLSHDVNDEDLLRAAFDDEGLKLNLILHLPKKEFDSSFSKLLEYFNDNSTLQKRVNEISSSNLDDDITACTEAIRKADTSNYGGNSMWINPRFKARGMVVNPKHCFYVMEFNNPEIEDAKAAISQKLESELGIQVIKSEDIFDPNRVNDMVENIWQDIVSARFVIADLSNQNPNVFYELGICDTLGKRVIPICSKDSFSTTYKGRFPFDIQQEYTILYGNSFTEKTKLQDEVLKRAKAIVSGETVNIQQ
ncbi:hypothetical protein [Limosilactobacillus oris]|uniref:hypothetical protein n=1 Tax=Limosilactobacillus oris TaxID=1632 RepID=UPI0024B33166|nr:hypothetical protein [Limosilactobacillus oris]WHO84913.1 hypothetical protein QLX69_05950 [Limosilactobacillus oris]